MPQYAYFDSTAGGPTPVIGWYDTDEFSYSNLPPAASLLELTAAQWAARLANPSGWAITAGTLFPYTPPPAPVDTRIAAKVALDASDTTMHRVTEAVALGLTTWTTADVVTFVEWRRELRAIVGGTSTTSAVPARPAFPAGT